MKKLFVMIIAMLIMSAGIAYAQQTDIYGVSDNGIDYVGYVMPAPSGQSLYLKDDNGQMKKAAESFNFGDGTTTIKVNQQAQSNYLYKDSYYGTIRPKSYYTSGQSDIIIYNCNSPKYNISDKSPSIYESTLQILKIAEH